MSTTIGHSAAMQRASQQRANIVAFLNNATEPMSVNQIRKHVHETMGFDDHNIGVKLHKLVANNLIRKVGDDYSSTQWSINDIIADEVVSKPSVVKVSKSPKVINIDVVKATGKIRIAIQDLVVEIGFV